MPATSISFGDSALVVATPAHRREIARELETAGIKLADCQEQGRYLARDAAQVLSSIMREGAVDRELFDINFGAELKKMRQHAQNRNQGLTVYGECVALLWEQGQKLAALTIEQVWQDIFRDDRTFHLHCAYPTSVFADPSEIRMIHNLHSHVFEQPLP